MSTRVGSTLEVGPATGRESGADPRRESIGDLLRDLANQSAALLRGEIDLAKQEMRENVGRLKSGLLCLAIAACVGWVALMALVSAAILALAPVMGGALAGLTVAIALAMAAGLAALVGRRRLARAHLKPEQTIQSLREDKQWLKRMT